MRIEQKSNGKFVAVEFLPTKRRFRTTLTRDFHPVEATCLDDLDCREYSSIESVCRAIRKFREKL